MDTTLISALIGAAVSIFCVGFGWFLGAYEQRRRHRQQLAALSGALLMEALAAAWHILNMQEVMRQFHHANVMPPLSDIETYLPTPPHIYPTAGHHIAELGPSVARSLVEYHTHLEREIARSKRMAMIDGRRMKKEVRMELLKESISHWGYVAWACASSMDDLLPLAERGLTAPQLDTVRHYLKWLHLARDGKSGWSLDVWPTALYSSGTAIVEAPRNG